MGLINNMAFLKSNGACWTWGINTYGQLGNNTTTSYSSPIAVVGSHSFKKIVLGGTLSYGCIFGLKADGSLWGWGLNNYGQLGDNSITNRSSPVAVVGNHRFVNVASAARFCVGLKIDGSLWAWGGNQAGELGINNLTSYSSPVAVVGNHDFVQIACGSTSEGVHTGLEDAGFVIALKADGSAWAWGDNNAGVLGTNNATSYSSPVAVVGNHAFISVKSGLMNTIALKSDGSTWGWGYNDFGNLGDNSRTSRSSPVAVVGSHQFVEVSQDWSHSAGRKADGSVWCWGSNLYGLLGTNNATSYSSPVAVVGSHSFVQFACTRYGNAGLKIDGSLWTWGRGENGRLGTNTVISYSSPVAVVGNHLFAKNFDRVNRITNDFITAGIQVGIHF